MKKKRRVRKNTITITSIDSGIVDLGLLPKFAIDTRPIQSEIAQYVLAAEYRRKLDGDLHSRIYSPR